MKVVVERDNGTQNGFDNVSGFRVDDGVLLIESRTTSVAAFKDWVAVWQQYGRVEGEQWA